MDELEQKRLEIEKKIEGSNKLLPSTEVVIKRDEVFVDSRDIIIILNGIDDEIGFSETLRELREGLKLESDLRIECNVSINERSTKDKKVKINYCDFSNITFKNTVSFNMVTFADWLFIRETEFNKVLKITHSTFEAPVTLNIHNFDPQEEFNSNLHIQNCHFKSEISAGYLDFSKRCIIKKCRFDSIAYFENSIFNRSDFSNNNFQKKADFRKCTFHDVDFSHATFEGEADFYNASFLKPVKLFKISFLKAVSFTSAKFREGLKAMYCNTPASSVISFDNATFENALDLSRSSFTANISFSNIKFPPSPSNLEFYKQKDDFDDITNPYFKLRGTYNLIKHSFEKAGNRIEALKFKAYEMDMYRRELEQDKKKKYSGEWWIMKANYCSNDFGLSWKKGVKFTTGITIVPFLLTLLILSLQNKIQCEWSWTAAENTIGLYFQILNVTNWDIETFGVHDSPSAYITIFVGRIFIGFGYYQTIQAFRKYGEDRIKADSKVQRYNL